MNKIQHQPGERLNSIRDEGAFHNFGFKLWFCHAVKATANKNQGEIGLFCRQKLFINVNLLLLSMFLLSSFALKAQTPANFSGKWQ